MPKIYTFLLLLSLLLAGTIPGIPAQNQAAQSETGFTKVIVKLKVPGIQGLTNESRKHKAVWPGKSVSAKGRQADLRLKNAIKAVSDEVLEKLNGTAYTLNRRYVSIPYLALDVSPEALSKLGKMNGVIFVDEDVPHKRGNQGNNTSSETAEEPGLSAPALNDTAGLIGATEAWNMGFTGDGWYIAMIDCGLRSTHEMFAGKDIVEQCYSVESECPNGQTSMSGTGAAAQQNVSCSLRNHGTWTTGAAAGNSATLSGIAPDADIIAIQVCSRDSSTNCILDYASDVTSALDFIYANPEGYPIAAVNLSIGYNPSMPGHISPGGMELMSTAIDNLKAAGIPVIAAVGNAPYLCSGCGEILFPASDSDTVAVGATYNSLTWWSGSCYTAEQDLFAPGVSIYTSTGSNDTAYGNADNGTSMAAPHVTGAWTLMKQVWPSGTYDQIKDALVDNGEPVTDCLSGTSPRVKVDDAINAVRYISVSRPYGTESVAPGGTITISWNTGPAVSGDVMLIAESLEVGYFIEMSYPHDGSPYTWTLPTNFPLYSQTKIQVRQGSLVGESQPFSVGEINVTYPTAGRTWRTGNTYTITWNSQGLDGNIRIYALEQPQTATPYPSVSDSSYFAGINISTSYPVSAGSYSWTIPQSASTGSYKIEIRQDKVKGYSPAFYIQGGIIIEIPDKVID